MKKLIKKPSRALVKKLILILGAIIMIAIVVALILGFGLLNRISRPDVATAFEQTDEELLPEPTPSPVLPTTTPSISPTPSPSPTPEVILPMSDLCEQTRLDDATLARMKANSENTTDYFHMLLIGIDRRSNSGKANADTMMIATIDKKNQRLKLTSIMRDLLVDVPGYGYEKLNSAAAKGGMDLLLETINTNFNLNITNYVLVDFSMFTKVVDAIGGVTVKMNAEEISAANDCIAGLNKERGVEYLWDGFIFANPGNVKLTGKQALGYARIRKIDSDYTRTNRQFKVLTAAYAKFMSLSLTKQYSVLYDIMPLVETNISNADILYNMGVALGLNANGLLSFRVPVDDLHKSSHYERKYVLLADMPANAKALHEFMFDSSAEAEEAKVLKPGASLPPRTPTPTIAVVNPDGSISYYFVNDPNQLPISTPDILDPEDPFANEGDAVLEEIIPPEETQEP